MPYHSTDDIIIYDVTVPPTRTVRSAAAVAAAATAAAAQHGRRVTAPLGRAILTTQAWGDFVTGVIIIQVENLCQISQIQFEKTDIGNNKLTCASIRRTAWRWPSAGLCAVPDR